MPGPPIARTEFVIKAGSAYRSFLWAAMRERSWLGGQAAKLIEAAGKRQGFDLALYYDATDEVQLLTGAFWSHDSDSDTIRLYNPAEIRQAMRLPPVASDTDILESLKPPPPPKSALKRLFSPSPDYRAVLFAMFWLNSDDPSDAPA